jgi:transposase
MIAPLGAKVAGVEFQDDVLVLFVRASRRRLCCSCGFSTASAYDRSTRRWRHLDAFGTKVILQAEIRRLSCRICNKVVTEEVVWARHGARHTLAFENLVAWWCQRADRTSVAGCFRCDWASVTAIVTRVVTDHLTEDRFERLARIGVDEISWSGHHYVTVVVNQDSGYVIWVGEGKSAQVLEDFYDLVGQERCARLEAVSIDMGRAYSAATRAKTTATICWDPFHVVKLLNKAVTDTMRWANLTRQGLPLSKREATDLRWALLKKAGDLTLEQAAVLERHRRAGHARCRIPPMLKAVRLVRENRVGILAAVELGLSNSRLEGTNSKIRMINHRGYGHHSVKTITAMIYLCCSGIELELPWLSQPSITPARRTVCKQPGE